MDLDLPVELHRLTAGLRLGGLPMVLFDLPFGQDLFRGTHDVTPLLGRSPQTGLGRAERSPATSENRPSLSVSGGGEKPLELGEPVDDDIDFAAGRALDHDELVAIGVNVVLPLPAILGIVAGE